MRGGIWFGSSGSTGNEMLPPLLLVRFILLLLYIGRSQTNNGELGRNAERCFRHQLRVMS